MRRGHNDVAARLRQCCNLHEKVIRVRDMLDDLGGQYNIELSGEANREEVTGCEVNNPALMFQLHVAYKIFAKIVPCDFITHLRKRQREIALSRRNVEDG